MRADPLRSVLLLALALCAQGCVGASLASDLRRVRGLARVERLASVENARVELEDDPGALALLSGGLSAETAVRVAMLNNRGLRARLRELGVARGALMQAGLPANPLVEVEFSPERQTGVAVRLEYELTSLVLAPLRAGAAAADLEAARYDAAGAVLRLGFEVRAAVFALQASQQRLALAQQGLDAVAAARDAAQALADAGNVGPLALAAQVAAYERARVSVAELELEAASRREELQRLLGLHGEGAVWSLEALLREVPEAPPPLERLEVRVLDASLELAAHRQRLEALARRTGVARTRGWLPEVTADVHLLTGDPNASAGVAAAPQVGGGVSVRLPFFDRQQGTVRALEASFDAMMERYVGLAVDLRSAAREARNRVLSAHARARHFQRVLVPAERVVLEQTQLQYNAMQVGVFQLLQARGELLAAQLGAVEARREYWTAVAALEGLLAGQRVAPRSDARGTAAPTDGAERGAH